jgi:gliding motility-associated-like protein
VSVINLLLKSTKKYLILGLCTAPILGFSQQILDPCFLSPDLGRYTSTPEIAQVCLCDPLTLSSNMLEWNGTEWLGVVEDSDVMLAPPPGCGQRAIWCGHQYWTRGGEAFALKLDRPFKAGVEYEYTFTYAYTGIGPIEPFSPIIYTNNKPEFNDALKLGRFPPAFDWETHTFKFIASANQITHDWLILNAFESSGIILANCTLSENLKTPFLRSDTTLCAGGEVILSAPINRFYEYLWSTGERTSSITVRDAGIYSVKISLPICSSTKDEVMIDYFDCAVVLEMPNVFTPNGDGYNALFKPIRFNYLESGTIQIFNRWGKLVFEGDLFTGWNGFIGNEEATTGVYYWECFYTDKNKETNTQKGFVQLSR